MGLEKKLYTDEQLHNDEVEFGSYYQKNREKVHQEYRRKDRSIDNAKQETKPEKKLYTDEQLHNDEVEFGSYYQNNRERVCK